GHVVVLPLLRRRRVGDCRVARTRARPAAATTFGVRLDGADVADQLGGPPDGGARRTGRDSESYRFEDEGEMTMPVDTQLESDRSLAGPDEELTAQETKRLTKEAFAALGTAHGKRHDRIRADLVS